MVATSALKCVIISGLSNKWKLVVASTTDVVSIAAEIKPTPSCVRRSSDFSWLGSELSSSS